MTHPGRFMRSLLFACLATFPMVAHAAVTELRVLFDSDNNPATGCTVSGMAGVEQVLVTQVTDDGTTANVTQTHRLICSGGVLGGPVDVNTTGWHAGFQPASGFLLVETAIPFSAFGPGTAIPSPMRVGFDGARGGCNFADTKLPNGDPLVFPKGPGGRRRAVAHPGPDRVIILDGLDPDWAGISPLAPGSAAGSSDLKLIQAFAYANPDDFTLYFNFNVNTSGAEIKAVDDFYTRTQGDPSFQEPAPGVLANDEPNCVPLTAIQVGVPAHGQVTLNSDGSFTYEPNDPDSLQPDSFAYKATHGSEESNVATVTIDVIDVNQAPVVITPAQDEIVCAGTTAFFNAQASGNPTPSVQWSVSTNGGTTFTNIPGATSDTLSFTANAGQDGNLYRATFTNGLGSAETTASLTVNNQPNVTLDPVSQTICAGSPVTFTAAATDATSVQWQVSTGGPFTNIPGANSTSLNFVTAASDNGKQYRAVFTNSCGTDTTAAATLTVNPNPTPTITPAPAQVCANSTGNTANGPAGAATYAWSISNGTITSASNIQNITYTAGASGTVGLTLVVTTGAGCSNTNTVNVTINANPATPVITTPAQVCANSIGNAASGPAGAATYAWSIVNGTITSATNIQNITYTAGAAGTVDLTLVVTNASGCSATNTVNVVINANPTTPTITPTPAQVCANSTGNTAAGPAGATTYAWSISNGTITSATNTQNITYTAGASGTVGLTLVVTNAAGCSASNNANVTINANPATPTITPSPAQVCANSTGNTANGPAGATTYAWSISNGTITSAANIQNITYDAGAPGTVGLTLVVTNASGCSATNTVNVTVNPTPTSTITPTPAQVCANSTGNTAAGPAGMTTYAWSIVNGTITSATNIQNITYTAGASGTVDLTLVVTNAFGCSDSDTVNVIINANPTTPTITPNPAQVCANSTGNTADGPAGATTYAWSIVNGTITSAANIQTITYTAGAAGTVDLTLVVTNAAGCSATNTVNVTINANPATPTITPTPAQVCANSTGNTADGPAGATTYAWSISNGTITSAANIQTITYTAGASGTVGLTLVVTNASGCSASNNANVPINANPATPTITPTPAQVCANSTGNTAAGPAGATTYAWSIVNGTITSATNIQNITYDAGASGTVDLTLVVTNASGCSATNTVNVIINANPTTPTITPTPAQVCANSTGNSAAGPAGATTYAWSIVNGTITSAANIQNITYTAGASGTVDLTLVVTNASGCSATNTVNVTINPNPATPTITPTPSPVCGGSTGNTASGPAGATTYAWSIVNGTITSATNIQNITYTAGPSGTVDLTLVVTNASGCSASNTVNVPVNPSPATPTITPTPAQVCANSTGNSAAGPAGATTYAWSIVNGTITSATNIQNITYTAGASGTVDLTLVVTNASGCPASNTVNVTINANPVSTITPSPLQVCANSTGNSAAGPAGMTTYAWSIVNGTITSATNIQNITYTAGAAGTVDLTLVVTNAAGCSDSDTVNVVINANPATPTITPTPAQVCESSTGNTASGPAGATTYAWSIVNGTITSAANIQNITYTAGVSGTVDLTLVVTNASGCSATNTVNVTINPSPAVPTITPTPAQVCANSTGNTASGPAGATTYSWSIVNGTITSATNIQNITYTAGASGTVDLTLTVTNAGGCPRSNTVNVTINANPSTPTITPAPAQVCANSTGNTAAGPAGATTYAWSIVNGTITSANNIQNITYTAGAAGTVDLTLIVTNAAGCSATNTVNVTINANPTTPTITPTPAQVCANSTGNTAAGPAGATTYAWSIVNGTITSAANIQNITYTAGAAGTVDLTLVVTNAAGCSATNTVNVTINANPATPTITPTPAQVCGGSTGNTASGPAGATTYAWSIVNGTITSATNIQNITYTAGASGTVDLTLVVTNAATCSASNTVNVPINPSPAPPTITPTPAQVCANSTGNTAAGPAGATTYAWSIVNGSITSATNTQNITYTAGASGTVDLTLVVTNAAGCAASNTVNVTINANPASPAITPSPATLCPSSTGNTASGPAGATTYAWSIVNGTITSATNTQNITYNAGVAGTVDLTLVVTNAAGCSASNTVNVPISNAAPVVTLDPLSQSIQAGNPVTFTSTASGTPSPTVQWEVSTNGGGSWAPLGGETNTSLTFNTTLSQNGNQYRAVFTNLCGTATSAAATLTVTCPTITPARTGGGTFPAGVFNSPYNGQSFTASGGTGPYTFAVTGGTFPTNLSLASNGTISGTPTQTGTFIFTVTATDTASNCTGAASFSIAINPVATGETYNNLVNNTQAVVTGGTTTSPATPFVPLTGFLVTNDQPSGGVAVVAGTFATTQGGSVTIAADGSFIYTPPVTVSALASDSFNYTIASNTGGTATPTQATASVTLNLVNRVWYVNNNFGGTNGQSQSPFTTLAAAQAASTVGDIIYVYNGNNTTSGQDAGIVLKNNQQLIGEGVALVVNTVTLVGAGTKPQITNLTAASDVVTLADGNTVRGLTITGATRDGISSVVAHAGFTGDTLTVQNNTNVGVNLISMTGTVTITNSTISSVANQALTINNGTAAVTVDNTNTVNGGTGFSVSVLNRPAAAGAIAIGATISGGRIQLVSNLSGTISFTGSQTIASTTNTAVTMTTNAGATVNFSGTLSITTTTGSGFTATGGGTLNVSGTANITTGAAANGLSLNGITIGGTGVAFNSINTTGATTGIALTNVTGTVSVNGGTLSGGTTGVSLQGASTNLTLTAVTITGPTTGITNTTNFGTLTIVGAAVNVSAATALNLTTGAISGTFNNVTSTGGVNGVNLNAVTGTWGASAGALAGASGPTFNVTGGGGGTITWAPTISQANAANVVTIAGGNSNTINFNGNLSSTATSTGLTLTASSGTYNFNGATNTFSGAGGITISNGESGTITFSAGTAITTTGTPFTIAGAAAVSANITFSGTINKTTGGTLLNINLLSGSLLFNGTTLSGTSNAAGGVVAIISNVTGTLTANHLNIDSSNNNFGPATLVSIAGTNTGGVMTFHHMVLSANGTSAQGAGLVASGGGTVTVTNTGGNSSITTRNAVALSLTGVAMGTSAINSITVAGGAATVNGILLSNTTGSLTVSGGSLAGATGFAILGTTFGSLTTSGLTINNATGGGMSLTTGTLSGTFPSFSSTGGTHGLLLSAVSGTFNAAAGTITNPTTAGISITGLNPSVTLTGTISINNGRPGIATSNMTGGSITVSTVNVSGTLAGADAITLDGTNSDVDLTITSATIVTSNMDDGLVVSDLASGSAVLISGGSITSAGAGRRVFEIGGTVNCNCNLSGVTLSGNGSDGILLPSTHLGTYQFGDTTLNTPNGGTGIVVIGDTNSANTDSSVTFRSVNIATCTGKGIYVHDHSGSFTVAGTGAANSGGTISGCTQHGAKFGDATSANTGAKNISLTDMSFTGNGTANLDPAATCGNANAGTNTNCAANIDLQQVNTATLTRIVASNSAQMGINGKNVADLTLTGITANLNGNEALEDGIQFVNLTTTSPKTWQDLNLTNNAGRQLEVQNSSGTNNVTISKTGGGTLFFGNTAFPTLATTPSSNTSSQGVLWAGSGTANVTVSIQGATFARNFSTAFHADIAGSASANVTVNGGSMIDNGLMLDGGGVGTGSFTYTLTNLTSAYSDPAHTNSSPIGVLKGVGSSGTFTGNISNNQIHNGTQVGAAGPCDGCPTMLITNGGSSGTHSITISGNTIRHSQNGIVNITSGINVTNDSSQMNVTLTNNTFTDPDDTDNDLAVTIVNGTDPGDSSKTCATVTGNTITDPAGAGSWNANALIRLRHVQNNQQFKLASAGGGYAGAPTDTTAVANFLTANNTLSSAVTAAGVSLGAGTFVGGTTCP